MKGQITHRRLKHLCLSVNKQNKTVNLPLGFFVSGLFFAAKPTCF